MFHFQNWTNWVVADVAGVPDLYSQTLPSIRSRIGCGAGQRLPTRRGRIDRLSQRTRRALAVAALVGLTAMFAWSAFWLTTTVPSIVWGHISFALIGVTVIGAFVLYRADMPGHGLERGNDSCATARG